VRCHACGNAIETHAFPGAVVRCACGADNVVAALGSPETAPYRHAAPPAEPVVGPTPAHPQALGPLCPRCTRLLHDDEERSAMACDRCGGILVDHAVLSARVQAERPAASAHRSHAAPDVVHAPSTPSGVATDGYARCPECSQAMTPMNFGSRSGVVLDVCREHGTWFDRGELDAVLAFVRAGGLEGTASAPKQPADDPSSRAAMATLAVQGAYEQRRLQEDVNDLAYFLRTGILRPGFWSRQRARGR
jgi:Zn-finger nucleic acid-binding protein